MLSIVLLIAVVLLLITVPISVVIGIVCIAPTFIVDNFPANIDYVIRNMVSGVDNTPILAIPLFMLSGALMARGGISKKLFDVFAYFIGSRTAGMPSAVIITCLFYGAISGSGPATTAAVGAMTIPILVSLGYNKVFSAALVATAGGLGVIIPPSIPFILYGLATGVSVGAMFTAGILPGILIALCLMTYAYIYCRVKGEDKEKIKANHKALKDKGFLVVFKESFWALLTPIIILGGIYSGIVTPTEAATVSVFYALLICLFIYKTISVKRLLPIFVESVRMYAPLTILLAMAMALGRILTLMRVPMILADYITDNFTTKIGLLLVLNGVFLVMGMVMDTGPAIIILSPILMPIAVAMGIDPIHLGIIMVVNLAIGFVTPPFGMNLFVASPLIDTPVVTVGKMAYPFVLAFIIALAIITFVPAVSLILL